MTGIIFQFIPSGMIGRHAPTASLLSNMIRPNRRLFPSRIGANVMARASAEGLCNKE